MEGFRTSYKNKRFKGSKIEVDGKSFRNCRFEDCLIVVEHGDTYMSGCQFSNCKLMLRGNAYKIGKLITLFTGGNSLKVVDLDEPLFEKEGP